MYLLALPPDRVSDPGPGPHTASVVASNGESWPDSTQPPAPASLHAAPGPGLWDLPLWPGSLTSENR